MADTPHGRSAYLRAAHVGFFLLDGEVGELVDGLLPGSAGRKGMMDEGKDGGGRRIREEEGRRVQIMKKHREISQK